MDLLLKSWTKKGAFIKKDLYCKKWTFQHKIVVFLFVRVVHPNLPNPLATGLINTNQLPINNHQNVVILFTRHKIISGT